MVTMTVSVQATASPCRSYYHRICSDSHPRQLCWIFSVMILPDNHVRSVVLLTSYLARIEKMVDNVHSCYKSGSHFHRRKLSPCKLWGKHNALRWRQVEMTASTALQNESKPHIQIPGTGQCSFNFCRKDKKIGCLVTLPKWELKIWHRYVLPVYVTAWVLVSVWLFLHHSAVNTCKHVYGTIKCPWLESDFLEGVVLFKYKLQ